MRKTVRPIIGITIWALSALAWAAPLGAAETAPPRPEAALAQTVSLDRLIDEALRMSPAVQAKRRAWEAAKSRALVAWLPEDPMVGVDVEGQTGFFRLSTRADTEYMVQQALPFPTTLWLRAQAALRESQAAFQAYQEETRQAAWHIEQPYHELYLAQKTVEALEQIKALAQKLVRAAQARYESNQASQQDLLKAQIELAKVDIELFNWREKIHLAHAHVAHILGASLETRYAVDEAARTAPPALSRPDLEQLALRQRPELKMLEASVKRAKTQRMLAATSWLPEITGRVEARQFNGAGGVSEHDTFLGFTVPAWSLLKGAGGEWRAANKDVQQAEAFYTEMKNEVFLAIHEAYSKAQSAQHAVEIYDTLILPQAKQQAEVALAAYEAGRADFLALIDAQRTLRDTQVAYYQVKADYELGLSDLRLAVGSDWTAGGKGE